MGFRRFLARLLPRHGSAVAILGLLVSGVLAAGEERIVRVGVYDNPPKIGMVDGRPEGFFVDLIEHIARAEGWRLQYVHGGWSDGLARLERGEIDLMPDVAISPARRQSFSFHQTPVLLSWSQVYAAADSGIRSILDLKGRRITVVENSVQHEMLADLMRNFSLDARLVPVADFDRSFRLVADGQADAAVSNRFYGESHAKIAGLEATAIIFAPSDLFFATGKGRAEDLLQRIDDHLTAMKQDDRSIYYASQRRWFSQEPEFRIPAWVRTAVLAGALVLALSLAGSVMLRRQVSARTRELRLANQSMEERIVQRTAELAAAMQQAQAADRLKSAFLATMSHELRTPLNSIIGFTGILMRELPGPLNPEQRKQLGMVQGSARHLLLLINDVLDMSKIEAGQLELVAAPFDLRGSLERVVKVVAPLAEKEGLGLRLDLPADLPPMIADQRRFEQVLLNLLGNAIKFSEQGEIRVHCRVDGEHCLLAVADSGIGIKPEDLPGLFKPFHQVDSGFARKREGTGLGLSICKRLLDAMGGAISVESSVGRGSTFTIRIPWRGGGGPCPAPC